jgi:Uma2 family endonuclease
VGVTTTRPPVRYDELLQVPDTKVAEIIDGELIVTPRPAFPHAHAGSVLGADPIGAFHRPPGDPLGPGGWWLLDEPELHFGDDVIVPDQAGWRRDRIAHLPNVAAYAEAPDWVCEVISPSTGKIDRSRKMLIYAREGVGHLWIVDPLLHTIEVYRLDQGHWVVAAVHGGEAPVRLEPFAEVELAIGRWWLETA